MQAFWAVVGGYWHWWPAADQGHDGLRPPAPRHRTRRIPKRWGLTTCTSCFDAYLASAAPPLSGATVYVAPSLEGRAYHRALCPHQQARGHRLDEVPKEIALARGLSACAVCAPEEVAVHA